MPPSRAMHPVVRPAFFAERYAVYDEFAAGGMATVHFARLNGAHGFRRTVAVKRLLPHLTRDQDFALMLIDEARLASRVRHHNVVSTLDVVQTADELLLVMEYIHGESLAKLARWSAERNESVPVAIALAIAIDASRGLDAAHEAKDEQGRTLGLVHRDVSPQNILIGLDGITRIADFGVAKAAGRAQSTRDGIIKGKLAYMAPEQLDGGALSRASDVFATAAVLWELLAGERLFAGKNHAETVFKVLSAPIPPPSARRAELSPELDTIVLRGLERDPTRRYASARELALALESVAPRVRPSELSCWVERVVGDRLSSRARKLRAIEEGEESEAGKAEVLLERAMERDPAVVARTQSVEGELDTLPRGPTTRRARRERAGEQLGSEQRAARQLEHAGSLAAAQSGPTVRLLMACVLMGLLSLLSAALWFASPRRGPAGSTLTSDALHAARTELGQDAKSQDAKSQDAKSEAVTTTSALPVHSAPSSRAAQTIFMRDAAVSKHVQRGTTDVRTARPSDRSRVRPAHKRGGEQCDPPYAIDPAGRVLFKAECM